MSDSRFNSWRDFLLYIEVCDCLNKNADKVLDTCDTSSNASKDEILEALRKNPQVTLLAVN